ncbi:PilN domain-containing protein [Tunturiibacter gelidoferens]|uniref:Type IV pilus assembly protein PilN n=1 Tax=Tunturiibacter lichenicola TaxID=2051959 RepID=A0A7Y9NQA3_9BACT|nr:PilN domain-containing protein [Edaphobacter lichenicola]NYF52940.1 type IV pilus assembly protein PilN [Edaphobacter lichenicola]
MRISVNLANRPFIELRPLFAKLRLAMVVLALLAVGLGFALHSLNAKARVAQAQMDALKAKTQRYQNERQANEARMHQPQNMAVLERSRFLNQMFAEKSFSWTAVMMDLEKVLPVGVQVTSIDPAITKEGDVNIRLRVSGDRDKAVQLVRNLETSQRFLSPRLASEQAQTQEGNRSAAQVTVPGAVQFDVLSGYNPLPERSVKDVAAKGKGGAAEGDSPADGVKKKRATAPKSASPASPKSGLAKTPAQKGAAR